MSAHMTTQTLPVPSAAPPEPGPSWLPRPGAYAAAGDRCIVEISTRLGPLTTLRRRVTADEATLTVAPTPDDCVLALRLTGDALGGDELSFVSTALEPRADGAQLLVHGELATADTTVPGVPATLPLRVVSRTDDTLLVLGTARVPYGHLRRTTGFALSRIRPADQLRLLVAAEFTCPA
ncbi:hypothetical protein OG785_36225 [Streptomyces sp. NBC_00006]|uniref:hypothetical protein n=1 Tax=unclassified Streptomyces TaxID=2593676 RepID=UPI002251AF9A|nr:MULTISPECIES: hypothetical protein [unclassified Streptomyces]MCX4831464.1 hypothetical protein [Streptomyces sp. NBC_01016]MCX5535988.1 hypothetical protein [Streptomyces sp. NBC_00006]